MNLNLDLAISSFKEAFFDDIAGAESPSGRKTTWNSAYHPYLRRLEQVAGHEPLMPSVLLAALKTYKPGSRSRQQAGSVLARLARSAGIELPPEWEDEAAGYVARASKDDPAVCDKVILSSIDSIPNKQWKRVYSLIAVYGLRNYEPFFIDFDGQSINGCPVVRLPCLGECQARVVWPLYRDWVHVLGDGETMSSQDLPSVNTNLSITTLQQIGRRVSEQFRRYKLPVTARQLRHSWAIRAITGGIPDTLAAKMLGLDISRYISQYMPHIEQRDSERLYRYFLERKDVF